MRKVIYDIEANSLTPTRIWCVVAKDINTDEVFTFLEDDKDKFVKFCSEVQQFIGHNILQYDNYWINKLWGTNITVDQTLDTLVLSRLLNSCKEVRGKIELRRSKNQHSLQAWGDGQCADWYEKEVTIVDEKLSPPFPDLEDAIDYANGRMMKIYLTTTWKIMTDLWSPGLYPLHLPVRKLESLIGMQR